MTFDEYAQLPEDERLDRVRRGLVTDLAALQDVEREVIEHLLDRGRRRAGYKRPPT